MGYTCEICSSSFKGHHGEVNRYCSTDCFSKARKDNNPWFKCSCCLAKIGFGARSVGKILNKKNHSIIATKWKNEGITSNKPECGSWSRYVERKNAEMRRCLNIYSKEWIKEVVTTHSDGFTWSSVWDTHKDIYIEKRKAKAKERRRDRNKAYKEKNKEKYREYNNKYCREYARKKRATDPVYRAKENIRKRFKDLLKTAKRGGSMSSSNLIGCSTRELAKHLESKFTNKMSWDNYGSHWHVDHILPCASFDHSNKEQVKQCWHYTNLQPLEAMENIKKGDTIIKPQMKLQLGYV